MELFPNSVNSNRDFKLMSQFSKIHNLNHHLSLSLNDQKLDEEIKSFLFKLFLVERRRKKLSDEFNRQSRKGYRTSLEGFEERYLIDKTDKLVMKKGNCSNCEIYIWLIPPNLGFLYSCPHPEILAQVNDQDINTARPNINSEFPQTNVNNNEGSQNNINSATESSEKTRGPPPPFSATNSKRSSFQKIPTANNGNSALPTNVSVSINMEQFNALLTHFRILSAKVQKEVGYITF